MISYELLHSTTVLHGGGNLSGASMFFFKKKHAGII